MLEILCLVIIFVSLGFNVYYRVVVIPSLVNIGLLRDENTWVSTAYSHENKNKDREIENLHTTTIEKYLLSLKLTRRKLNNQVYAVKISTTHVEQRRIEKVTGLIDAIGYERSVDYVDMMKITTKNMEEFDKELSEKLKRS
tara:strand:+ start:769 stop:1191 length:423 start_codon:yes stop_codon:yes gene_type:complete